MNNILLVAPLRSLSGYGERSRKFLEHLVEVVPEPIDILMTKWGNVENDPHYQLPSNCQLLDEWNLSSSKKYEIAFVIGMLEDSLWNYLWANNTYYISAGIETDEHQLDKDNYTKIEHNLKNSTKVFLSSVHSVNTLVKSFNKYSDKIEVLHENVLDITKYKSDIPVLRNIKPSYKFLCIGNWLPGEYGHDRKNIPKSIEMFIRAFHDVEKSDTPPLLVLKTELGMYGELERNELKNMIQRTISYTVTEYNIKNIPEIVLVHGLLTDTQLVKLYEECDVLYTLTHGEGFGRSIYEFAQTGKPIIAPDYSGYLDVLDIYPNSYKISGKMDNVSKGVSDKNKYLSSNSKWFYPDDNDTILQLKTIFNNKPAVTGFQLKLNNDISRIFK